MRNATRRGRLDYEIDDGGLYDEEAPPMQLGALAIDETPAEPQRPIVAAVLWLPDPEARRGMREHYIYHQPQPQPQRTARPFGFAAMRPTTPDRS